MSAASSYRGGGCLRAVALEFDDNSGVVLVCKTLNDKMLAKRDCTSEASDRGGRCELPPPQQCRRSVKKVE